MFSLLKLMINSLISLTLQAIVLGPSFTGCGKRPDLTPAHHVDLLTGMNAGIGGFALLSPIICLALEILYLEVAS